MISTYPHRAILYQSDQVLTDGCCFSTLNRHQYPTNPSRVRVYSEPKESSGRKIELVTPRKGFSQGKDTHHTSGTLSHQKIASQHLQKVGPTRSIITFNYNSKVTTTKGSQKCSKIPLIKTERKERHQQQLSPCNKIQVIQLKSSQGPTEPTFLGLEHISEISIVSEEFISHESATNIARLITQPQPLPIFNWPNNQQGFPRHPPQTMRQQVYGSCFQEKRTGMDRKRYEVKAQNKRKRIV